MIKIIENFVNDNFHKQVCESVIHDNMPWYFQTGTMWPGYESPPNIPNSYDAPQFVHSIYNEGKVVSNLAPLVDNIAWKLSLTENIYTGKIFRAKINLNYQSITIPIDGHYKPHRDLIDHNEVKSIIAIYYLNDCDGDTLIFDDTLNIIKRISPKANMLIYFDGKYLHAGSPPRKSNNRILLNMVFLQQ